MFAKHRLRPPAAVFAVEFSFFSYRAVFKNLNRLRLASFDFTSSNTGFPPPDSSKVNLLPPCDGISIAYSVVALSGCSRYGVSEMEHHFAVGQGADGLAVFTDVRHQHHARP